MKKFLNKTWKIFLVVWGIFILLLAVSGHSEILLRAFSRTTGRYIFLLIIIFAFSVAKKATSFFTPHSTSLEQTQIQDEPSKNKSITGKVIIPPWEE